MTESEQELKSQRGKRRNRLFSHDSAAASPAPAVIHAPAPGIAALVFALVAGAAAISVVWIDRPLARAVARLLPPGQTVPKDIPDLLIWFVIAVTAASLLVWAWARWRGKYPRLRRLAPLIVIVEPLSLAVKYLAKAGFGRAQTRLYIHHPWVHDFHWLHGHGPYLGFPSGHMLIAGAFIAVIVAVFPRLRPLGWLALIALALALILTSYHFLGDVLAGWLIGATLAWFILAADARLRPAENRQTRL